MVLCKLPSKFDSLESHTHPAGFRPPHPDTPRYPLRVHTFQAQNQRGEILVAGALSVRGLRGLPFGQPPFLAFLAMAASLAGLLDLPPSLPISAR